MKSWETTDKKFKFIDLFAGIGGFRIAAERHGGQCVFSSEIDEKAIKTYKANFYDTPDGDITEIDAADVPDHDILFAGFPCQAFSISGRRQGFLDATKGTLFFDIARIIKEKEPRMVLLENVKNFAGHDEGKTISTVVLTLRELGYKVYWQMLRSSDYGVPQARERIYIAAFRKELDSRGFTFPAPDADTVIVRDILDHPTPDDARIITRAYVPTDAQVKDKRSVTRLGNFTKENRQGNRLYSIDCAGVTLSANSGGVARLTGAYDVDGVIRKLSPRECARMQGFPEDFDIPVTTNQAQSQFGNSVSVPVIEKIITEMVKITDE